jgi:hypothetical protein
MNLVRDCLDKQMEDRNKRRMGRVDGIVLELAQGRQPRVAYVELGVKTLMNRLSLRLGRKLGDFMERRHIKSAPYRIAWSQVRVGLNHVEADVEAEKTPALEWELWLRSNVIRRIPGGK